MTVDKKTIQSNLDHLLESPHFRASSRQRQFLTFIINETLENRTATIKGYSIAIAVYGRNETFDPQVDPIVRVEAGRLRRALEHYYLTGGVNDPVRIDIPKGSYIPTFHANQPVENKPKQETTKRGSRKSDTDPSIAVMPLKNMSGNREQEYLCNGLTEELTNELARFQDIKVIAAHSTLRYKDQKFDPQIVGRELGVRYLLTGNILYDPSMVKVTIQLIDTSGCRQIWAKSFRRNQTTANLITMQEQIAYRACGTIADHYGIISRRLSRESRKKIPEDMQAYDAVLRFYHYETVLTAEAFETALDALHKAIEIEPDYGLAHAMIGHLHADNYALGFKKIDAPLEKALFHAQKGVAMAPRNQFVQDALTLVFFHRGDKSSFMRSVEETTALNPNSPYIIGVAGWHLILFGEWERGRTLLKKGMQLNPYYPTWFHLATFIYHYRAAEYEDAYAEALKFNFPTLFWDPLTRAAALGQLGRIDEAESALKQLLELVEDFETRGRHLIRTYVKVGEVVEMIVNGLQKAGLAGLG